MSSSKVQSDSRRPSSLPLSLLLCLSVCVCERGGGGAAKDTEILKIVFNKQGGRSADPEAD